MISIELPPGSSNCAVDPEARSARETIRARAIAYPWRLHSATSGVGDLRTLKPISGVSPMYSAEPLTTRHVMPSTGLPLASTV